MRFIETGKDVSELLGLLKSGECFIHVFDRFNAHPIKNEPLVAMIRHFDKDEVYIISFSHLIVFRQKLKHLNLLQTPSVKVRIKQKKSVALCDNEKLRGHRVVYLLGNIEYN